MCGSWRFDEQDLNTYKAYGLVKSPFRIPDEQLGRMRESLDRLLRDNAHIAPETLIRDPLQAGDFGVRTRGRRRARPDGRHLQHEQASDLAVARTRRQWPQ